MNRNKGLRDLELPEDENDSLEEIQEGVTDEVGRSRSVRVQSFIGRWSRLIGSFILRKEVIGAVICAGVIIGLGAYFLVGGNRSASGRHARPLESKQVAQTKASAQKQKKSAKKQGRKSAFPVPAPKTSPQSEANSGSVGANSTSGSQTAEENPTVSIPPVSTPVPNTAPTPSSSEAQERNISSQTITSQAPTSQPVTTTVSQVTYERVDLKPYIGQPYQTVVKVLTEKGATVVVNFVLAQNNQETGTVIDIKGEKTTATLTVAWE